MSYIITIAFLTGFIGDALLQLLTYNGYGGKTGWGLIEYFKQHGRPESMFIAGGMMAGFYILYVLLCQYSSNKLDILYPSIIYLSLIGVILDLIFRVTMVFNSLNGYYRELNYIYSAIWGIIPMILPLIIYNLIGLSNHDNHSTFI